MDLVAYPNNKVRLYFSVFAKTEADCRFAAGCIFRYGVRYRVYHRKFPYLENPCYAHSYFGAVLVDFLCSDNNFCFKDVLSEPFLNHLIVFRA